MKNWDPDAGSVIPNQTIAVAAALTINQANANAYNGKTLIFASALTVTLAVGLPIGFGFAFQPPGSGNASIASDGTVLLNGATTTVTRTLASNLLCSVAVVGTDSYAVTGA